MEKINKEQIEELLKEKNLQAVYALACRNKPHKEQILEKMLAAGHEEYLYSVKEFEFLLDHERFELFVRHKSFHPEFINRRPDLFDWEGMFNKCYNLFIDFGSETFSTYNPNALKFWFVKALSLQQIDFIRAHLDVVRKLGFKDISMAVRS